MTNIGIIYGSTMGNTESAAKKIGERLEDATLLTADSSALSELKNYDVLLLGSSTWGLGDLQDEWEPLEQDLKSLDLKGKKVAFFGTGDQSAYNDTFVDALGILYESLADSGAEFIGAWPTAGYEHSASRAVKNGKFCGLALDEDNQPEKTDERIARWVEQLKKEI